MTRTTVYTGQGRTDITLRAFNGVLAQASMWNTITNVLRTINLILVCYLCSDNRWYKTADGKLYRVKR